jgi:hypothetical protein
VVRRQQEQDLFTLVGSMGRRLSELQLQVFFLLASVITRHRPDGVVSLADEDVADAAAAMAGTLEASGQGLIAEFAGSSPLSEGLRRELDALLAELGKGGVGAGFAREAAEVLRGIERGARHEAAGVGSAARDYLTLIARVVPPAPDAAPPTPPSSIILP